MYFANPWGLLTLLSLPVIAFIHLYQRRFPPLEIGGLFLWLSDEQVKTAGQRIDRLPVTRTLLLELLIAGLLSLLLAQPRWLDAQAVRHWVIVLDNSASMLAVDPSRPSARDQAVAHIEQRLRAAGRRGRITLIATGRRPAMLAGPAATWEEAAAVLVAWRPEDTRHDFQAAWDTALQLDPTAQLLFVTDSLPKDESIPRRFEVAAFGEARPNLAFETARWNLDRETLRGSLFLRIKNHSNRATHATLVGRSAGREVIRRELDLDADQSAPVAFELPGGLKRLDLEITSTDDRLLTDSRVTLIEPQARTVRIANELPEAHPGRAAVERVLRSLSGVEVASPDSAHLRWVAAAESANGDDDRWQLAVGPITIGGAESGDGVQTVGPFLLDRRSELLEGVSLDGVVWAGIRAAESIPLRPLVSSGSHILLGQIAEAVAPHYLLNIDLSKSNLTDSPGWPILVNNLVELCRDSLPGLRRWNFRVDEQIEFSLPAERLTAGDSPLVLASLDRERKIARSPIIEIPPLLQIGVHELRDGQESIGTFATNFFDAAESDLSQLSEGALYPDQASAVAASAWNESPPWLWIVLIGTALTALLGDWLVLRQDARREVQ